MHWRERANLRRFMREVIGERVPEGAARRQLHDAPGAGSGLRPRRELLARIHSRHQTQQQINTRWQLAQQFNQPDPGRLNEE
eukprot:1451675-Pyramimonas_sp.AAC.1